EKDATVGYGPTPLELVRNSMAARLPTGYEVEIPSRRSAVAARPAASRDSMSTARSRGREPLWQEVLRRAAVTPGGRAVGVWEADARGRLHLLASSSEDLAPLAGELEAALRKLG